MSASTFFNTVPSATMPFDMLRVLKVWRQRARTRARDRTALALMSDRELMDIATNRFEVTNELAKPFWRG
jgi:uncharacterized protein YjiS (DUF1127 family)